MLLFLLQTTLVWRSSNFVNPLFKMAAADRGDGLRVLDDPESLRPRYRPSIWSLYKPKDITLYDLMYEDDWRKGQKI